MAETKIEWATHTANWLAGCTRVSPACQHCYAETMTSRLATMPNAPRRYREGVVEDRRWTGRIAYDSNALRCTFTGLLQTRSARRVFINSMSDTFHVNAPPESLADLALHIRADEYGGAISSTDHVIMLLTKRPERLLAWQREHFPDGLPSWVWVGCTVEDQARADARVPVLLEVNAPVRFLSCEPLLGPVDLDAWIGRDTWAQSKLLRCDEYTVVGEDDACNGCPSGGAECPGIWDRGLHWVIAGGESGAAARPSHPDWFRLLRDQCAAAGVPFLFKQWGEWKPGVGGPLGTPGFGTDRSVSRGDDGTSPMFSDRRSYGSAAVPMFRPGKHHAGRHLDGVLHDGYPGQVSGG